jgi:hypothetical protein
MPPSNTDSPEDREQPANSTKAANKPLGLHWFEAVIIIVITAMFACLFIPSCSTFYRRHIQSHHAHPAVVTPPNNTPPKTLIEFTLADGKIESWAVTNYSNIDGRVCFISDDGYDRDLPASRTKITPIGPAPVKKP